MNKLVNKTILRITFEKMPLKNRIKNCIKLLFGKTIFVYGKVEATQNEQKTKK